jgi:hypothetical protein
MVKFNVKADSGYYFKCRVFETKAEMYEYYVKYKITSECGKVTGANDWDTFNFDGFDEKLDFAAIVLPYERLKVVSKTELHRMKDIGEALFWRDRLGAGLVAHECLHMAMWHERLIEGNEDAVFSNAIGEAEERLAYCLTEFVRKFTIACYKRKIYD